MSWEQRIRRLGGSLAAIGLAAVAAGAVVYAVAWALDLQGVLSTDRATAMIIGGLIVGLVGAMFLLLAPDTLPPGERPP